MQIFQRVSIITFGLIFASCTAPLTPPAKDSQPQRAPDAGGEAYIAVEAHTGRIVASRNRKASRPVGSLTQIATAVVIFDWASAGGESLAQRATVPPYVLTSGSTNPMQLAPGDTIELRSALYSILMGGDGAAAETVAHHVGAAIQRRRGGSAVNQQPRELFVAEMNKLAKALEMGETRFQNPFGESQTEHTYSTAEDMARLAIYASRHPGLLFYSKQKSRKIGFLRGERLLEFEVTNSNPILGREKVDGLKSGISPLSGWNLMISADREPRIEKISASESRITPRRMIVVVLQSLSREQGVYQLLKTGWSSYDQWMAAGAPNGVQAQERLFVPRLR